MHYFCFSTVVQLWRAIHFNVNPQKLHESRTWIFFFFFLNATVGPTRGTRSHIQVAPIQSCIPKLQQVWMDWGFALKTSIGDYREWAKIGFLFSWNFCNFGDFQKISQFWEIFIGWGLLRKAKWRWRLVTFRGAMGFEGYRSSCHLSWTFSSFKLHWNHYFNFFFFPPKKKKKSSNLLKWRVV